MKGTIRKIFTGKGFGFILGEDGKEYFFHHASLKNANFEETAQGHTVTFEEFETSKGPRAEDVYLD